MSVSRTLIPALTSLYLIAATACGGGERALPGDEALDRSVASVEDVGSVLIRMIIQSEYASPDGDTAENTSTDVGYESDQVMFVHTVFGGELADDINESLYIGDDLYLRPHGHNWFVISPSQGPGDPNVPDIGMGGLLETYVDEIVPDIENLQPSGEDSILGETFYRYDGTYDPEFGPSGQATVWLRRESYLPRKVQVSAEERGDAFSLTLEFLDYDLPVALPDVPEARPWRDYELPDAPCSGDDLDGCLAPQEALTDRTAQWCEVEVCFVALGQVEPRLMEDLVTHFEDVYGLSVAVLGPSDVAPYLVAPLRGQIDASELIDYMLRHHGPGWDEAHHTIIGITPIDLYNADEHLSFIFGSKGTLSNPTGIVSTFRMDPRTYGQPANYNVLLARARKMATKYVGLLHYGLQPSSERTSPLYDFIGGLSDLDGMTELLPVDRIDEHDDIGGFAVGAMSDEDAIRALDALGKKLVEDADYVGVYDLIEPAFRDACPLEPFVRMGRLTEGIDEVMRTHERDGEIVRVEVDGDRAVVTSLDYSPARDDLEETTDEVVKIDGRWFIASDAEGIQACAATLLSEDHYTDAANAVLRFGVLAGGIATGSADGHGLYLQTFTIRFQDDCPFERYQAAWPYTYDRFTSAMSDPFTWDLAGSDDYVEIKSSEGRIATLMLEGEEWRMHEIAGLNRC